ncbi:lipase family protein [Metabacillus sediminilitoris]|uniref:Lipase family protein n=1 Tax=Metabacillus sediminilitoris TaxID=2567941 RepID=A0A4S4BRL4_9BACI|nr:lipase family protein [Metabacillus sediminilitoris]QGQ45485.1 lipase family protein [Metabacillus sediminilitoris]THF77658.1 lipase family protein [Metabacillus sediminilitoris]
MVFSDKNNIFNSKAAILLAAMSYQTYPFFLEGKLILPKGFKLRYTIRAFANVEDPTELVFGFIAESQDQIIIAFRGYAAYPADLLASYDIFQVLYPYVKNGGKTSRGFTCLYQSTRNNLIRQLNKLSTSKKLFVTGHNYGGALATLAALDIAVNTGFKNPFVYTYGSPRIGDPVFASRFNQVVKNSIRIVNIHDSFPTFPAKKYPPPFTEEGLYYQHVKTKYPISFQLNNTPRNDAIACYFKYLSKMNPDFSKALCNENLGFCPDTEMCVPFRGTC